MYSSESNSVRVLVSGISHNQPNPRGGCDPETGISPNPGSCPAQDEQTSFVLGRLQGSALRQGYILASLAVGDLFWREKTPPCRAAGSSSKTSRFDQQSCSADRWSWVSLGTKLWNSCQPIITSTPMHALAVCILKTRLLCMQNKWPGCQPPQPTADTAVVIVLVIVMAPCFQLQDIRQAPSRLRPLPS